MQDELAKERRHVEDGHAVTRGRAEVLDVERGHGGRRLGAHVVLDPRGNPGGALCRQDPARTGRLEREHTVAGVHELMLVVRVGPGGVTFVVGERHRSDPGLTLWRHQMAR